MTSDNQELVEAIEHLASVIEKSSNDIDSRLFELEKFLDELKIEIVYLKNSIKDRT